MDPSATPLSNSDFRALLATPRADRDAPATPSGFAKPSTPRGPKPDRGKTQSKTHKPAKSFKPKESTGEGEDDEDKDKYRDRAEERRRGVNPDYEGANQLAQVLSTGDVNIRNLSVEETKYLGGDIDHTHLVKGLDYALLQKERNRLKKEVEMPRPPLERNRLEKEEEDSKAATAKKAGSTASASEKASDSTDGPIKRGDLKIRTGVARNVANTLFFPQKCASSVGFHISSVLPASTGLVGMWFHVGSVLPASMWLIGMWFQCASSVGGHIGSVLPASTGLVGMWFHVGSVLPASMWLIGMWFQCASSVGGHIGSVLPASTGLVGMWFHVGSVLPASTGLIGMWFQCASSVGGHIGSVLPASTGLVGMWFHVGSVLPASTGLIGLWFQCASSMGDHIGSVLPASTGLANVTEMYKPFRMAFVYEFDNEEEVFDTDVPTTLRRSKADCPNPPEAVFAGIDTAVLERIAKVMSYIKTTGGKKMRKKEREEMLAANGLGIGSGGRAADATLAPGTLGRHAAGQEPHTAGLTAAAAAADEEDDIFGDAGTDYKPSVSEKKKKALAAAKNAPSGPGLSFEEDMELGDGSEAPQGASLPPGVEPGSAAAYAAAAAAYAYPLPPPPSGAPGPAGGEYGAYGQQGYGYGDAGGAGAAAGGDGMSAAAKEAERWRVRASKTEEKEVDFEESAYAECYPMQAGFVAEVVDSDDEDRAQMDGGKVGKSRYDFETEEEWHQYKETREQAPKAAFQFGVKAGDGRKGGKEMSLEKSRDQKLSSQLGKIQKLMQDKGHDHTDAFAKEAGADTPSRGTPRRGAGGSTPRHTGEDPNLVMGGKRQRI
eukprot:gene21686-28709_t